jgi:acyl carrier protein
MNERLLKILASVFEIKEVNISLELKKDDIDSWDSLKQMDLVVSLEEGYGIVLEMEEIVKMNSVQSIVDILSIKGILQ